VRRKAVLLADPVVRSALRQAWMDSLPGTSNAHEEGGFVLRDGSGNLRVERWPSGAQRTIVVPPHRGCRIGAEEIIASFHTHPNSGTAFLQEPSQTDKRAVRDDLDLKGASYEGEWVISQETLYLIDPYGSVGVLGRTRDLLGI